MKHIQNLDEIVDFCYNDICETADEEFNDSDVTIAFRRWIESKSDVYNESFKLKEISPKKDKQPEYTMLGKEKELKPNLNFGYASSKDEEIKKIGSFTDFTKLIDPKTPNERPVLNAGRFIENEKVKGYINRIEGKDVYIEPIDDPLNIKKFNIKDVIK